MYIRASLVTKHIPQIAKSTLFKMIHDKKIGFIISDRQYYLYWPDFKEYLEKLVLVDLQSFLDAKMPEFLQGSDDIVGLDVVFKYLQVDARKWKNAVETQLTICGLTPADKEEKKFVADELYHALICVRKNKESERDDILRIIANWQQKYRENLRLYIIPVPDGNKMGYAGVRNRILCDE